MEKNVFYAGLPGRRVKPCKEHASIYEISRVMETSGAPVYYTLSAALDKFANNVYRRINGKIISRYEFDFYPKFDYSEWQDIDKMAKAAKKFICEELDTDCVSLHRFVDRYYSLYGRSIISNFFAKEIEAGRLSESDYTLLQAVTNNGKTKLTENRDTKDKDGNVTAKDERLNITYNDNGRAVTVNYKVERSDIPASDFPTIIAAYKIAAKATNANSRYDKANKPKAESVLTSVRRENEDLRTKLERQASELEYLKSQLAILMGSK